MRWNLELKYFKFNSLSSQSNIKLKVIVFSIKQLNHTRNKTGIVIWKWLLRIELECGNLHFFSHFSLYCDWWSLLWPKDGLTYAPSLLYIMRKSKLNQIKFLFIHIERKKTKPNNFPPTDYVDKIAIRRSCNILQTSLFARLY